MAFPSEVYLAAAAMDSLRGLEKADISGLNSIIKYGLGWALLLRLYLR